MRTFTYLCSLLLLGGLAIESAAAQDARLRSLLDKAGLKYTWQGSSYKLLFDTEGGRTQVVYLFGSTEDLHGEPIAHFFSVGFKGTDLSDFSLIKMLMDSHKRKLGHWELTVSDDKVVGIYSVKVPLSGLTPKLTRSICSAVATIADDMESYLHKGSDDF